MFAVPAEVRLAFQPAWHCSKMVDDEQTVRVVQDGRVDGYALAE